MKNIVIVAAKRTAIGSFNGGLSTLKAHHLGSIVIRDVVAQAGLSPDAVSEVVMGQVLTAGQGQNPARRASIGAGLSVETPAWSLNQVCGSGLRAVALGAQNIRDGSARVVVAGGQESMSQAPHCAHLRGGVRMGKAELADTMMTDGLLDAFGNGHMGDTAENIARRRGIDRERQDMFAVASQNKAERSQKEGKFTREIVPVPLADRKGEKLFDIDEHVRSGTNMASLAKLRPVFAKEGTVTGGNASGINDGAAALLLMDADEAEKRNLTPLAHIASWAQAGVEPDMMGMGPIPASRDALRRAGWSVGDLDLIEANEAFAAQALAVNDEMGWDPEKVNVNGGAIALGHPIGASGCRILVTLLHEMTERRARKGLATLCIGGGMGIAMCVAR